MHLKVQFKLDWLTKMFPALYQQRGKIVLKQQSVPNKVSSFNSVNN